MDWIEALILGLVQGLTEYLPISSSGHLELGKAVLGVNEVGLQFDVIVHVATVLSTLLILWHEVRWILKGIVKPIAPVSEKKKTLWDRMPREHHYIINILVSMIPIGIVGLCFKDKIELLYEDQTIKMRLVGVCLLITAALLILTKYVKYPHHKSIRPYHAFIIGIAQALAVLPGLSRSGSTIATGLLIGNRKQSLAQFSFLMVIPPILGEALLSVIKICKATTAAEIAAIGGNVDPFCMLVAFLAAFISGCFACKWMIRLVQRGKLIYFAGYCIIIGIDALLFG